jgi:hypothetical protein
MCFVMFPAMRWISLMGIVMLITCLGQPAAAFTADSLDIQVRENGDTEVTFRYTLSWIEHIAVFLRIADPADELKKGLEGNSDNTVDVTEVTGNTASFLVIAFTSVRETQDSVVYTTPRLNFTEAEEILQEYWFAPLITTDLSPAVTTVTFPDGYTEQFGNLIEIPQVSHAITR